MGASDRSAGSMSLEAFVCDLDAVAERLELPRFAVVGTSAASPIAVAYAATHLQRVSRLVLIDPFPSGEAWARFSPLRRMLQTISGLAEDDWATFTRAAGSILTSFEDAAAARSIAAALEGSASPKTFLAYEYAMREVDVRPLLPAVQAPALVIHNDSLPVGSFEMSQAVASGLPAARFVRVPADVAPELDIIDEFLRSPDGTDATVMGPQAEAGGHGRRLTPRESDVLRLIARGRTNREISEDLVLSERTVARHITNIYAKLNLRSKAEATAYALRHELG
jgi:pimeloyl-ACP methyl ester carboxylesterase/DNA-binding CsgD family transcriptional regulator